MKQYINKDDISAKIENRIKETESMRSMVDPFWEGQISAFDCVLKILDTLEVKEVDLEKEYEEFVVDDPILGNFITNDTMGMVLAKHFFELGTKVSDKTKKDVSYVKIDRKVLFEMCDAILNHDGYADRDDCPENDFPYFVGWWDIDFRKKVENIRNNS